MEPVTYESMRLNTETCHIPSSMPPSLSFWHLSSVNIAARPEQYQRIHEQSPGWYVMVCSSQLGQLLLLPVFEKLHNSAES